MQYTQQKGIAGVELEDIYHRQRRIRADRDGDAGVARRRRRGADAGAGLSAVDGRGEPLRRRARCITCATRRRLACPTSTISARRSRRTRGRSSSSTRTIRPAPCIRETAARDRRDRPRAPARRASPTRSTTRCSTTARQHMSLAVAVRRRAVRHLQRTLEEVPGVRLPQRLDGRLRRRSAQARDYLEGLNILASMRLCAERARPVRDPDRARRPPEHPRPREAGRAPAASSATSPTT